MATIDADAVVIGAGHNGLVAACLLADAGWDVVILEAADHPGGAVASVERPPGWIQDRYSAFYPLSAASPFLGSLDLHEHGLRWKHAPTVLAHVSSPDDERAVLLHRDPARTAAGLDAEHPGDGETWLRLLEHWRRIRGPVVDALLMPTPPLGAAARLLARTGAADALRLARMLVLPVHRLGEELFGGQGGRLLLAGNAMHADIPSVAPVSGAFGWLLCMLAQDVGFPVPEGGAGRLTDALVSRARAAGAQLLTGARVDRVVVSGGRAIGVIAADGTAVRARRAVLADVDVTQLYRRLLPDGAVPARALRELDRFQRDLPTVKVNWALDGQVPWRAAGAAQAGTVHVGTDLDGLADWSTALATGRPSRQDFALVGQMATADPGRAPAGGQSLWAYSHLPSGGASPEAGRALADRLEQLLEDCAPGLRDRVVARDVQLPHELQADDANLVDGSLNGGTAQLQQQLVFRPLPGLGRPETPVERLYLASASAHPGGGVHGAAGHNAARAALLSARLGGVPGAALSRLTGLLNGGGRLPEL